MKTKMNVRPSAFSTCYHFWTNKCRPAKQVPIQRGRVWLAWLVGPSGQHKQLQTEGGGGGVNQFQGKPIRQPDNFKTLNVVKTTDLSTVFSFQNFQIYFILVGFAGKTKFAGKPVQVQTGNSSLDPLLPLPSFPLLFHPADWRASQV